MDMSALGGSGIQLLIKGNDLDQLAATASDLTGRLRSIEGTTLVEWNGEFTGRELRVTVDRDAAMRHQLTTAQVFQQVAAVLNQTTAVTTLRQSAEELPVLIINPDYESITMDTLLDLELTATGRDGETFTVTLDDIAEVREAASPQSISRVGQVRTTTVSAQIAQGYNIRYVSRDIEQMLATVELPAGFTVELSGENETIMESMNDLIMVLLLAILFIYLIMVAQFQSLLSPLIILFTIPSPSPAASCCSGCLASIFLSSPCWASSSFPASSSTTALSSSARSINCVKMVWNAGKPSPPPAPCASGRS